MLNSLNTPMASESTTCTLNFDGSSKGNPGKAGAGYIIYNSDGSLNTSRRIMIGIQTNNYAEYYALLIGLQEAHNCYIEKLLVKGDSMLVIRQMEGKWECKSDNLKDLYRHCLDTAKKFKSIKFEHIKRDLNKEADMLANINV